MRKKQLHVIVAVTAALSLVLVTTAFADQLEGDELATVRASGSLDLGTVCAGEESSGTLFLAVHRQGGGSQVYADGATITVTPVSASAGLTAGPTSGTITLPSDWVTAGTTSDHVTATITLDTDELGPFEGEVTYQAAGPRHQTPPSGDLERTDDIPVTAVVEDCSADETPPVVEIALDPDEADGSNGWYRSAVTVTIDATDDESDVTSVEYRVDDDAWQAYTAPFTVSDDGNHTVYARATSEGGTSDAVSESFRIDGTAPTVAVATDPSAPQGDNGWYTTAVTATFTATDNLSGFDVDGTPTAQATDSTGSLEGANLTLSSPAFTDWAGNTVAAGAASATVDVDLTDPYDVAFVGGPAAGASHVWGSVPAAPTCTAADDVSGLASCEVAGYSTDVGTHELTATATDNAGRTATATRTYTVLAWTLEGFHRPVDLDGVNVVKAGSTVPLKFNVFAGDTEVTDTSAVVVSFTKIACATSEDEDDLLGTTTGGTSFRYDGLGGQFVYNWQTPKGAAGNCYRATFTTSDGSSSSALFRLK